MEVQYSLLIDTNVADDDLELMKRIYSLLLPTDVSLNSKIKEYLITNSKSKQVGDKLVNYRYITNFINDKKTIEVFLKEDPNLEIINSIKDRLSQIKEITGYRVMKIFTKVKIEIESI